MMNIVAHKKIRQARRAICETCPTRKGVRCGACGCFLLLLGAYKDSKCSEGRW